MYDTGFQQWIAVDREQINELKVTHKGAERFAVEIAECKASVYDLKGQLQKGKIIKLGTGARKPQVASHATPAVPLASPVPAMGGTGRAIKGDGRDGLCVLKAFKLLGWDIELGPDPDFDALPTDLNKYSRKFILQKPVKWAYPGLLMNKRDGTLFSFNAIDVICSHAVPSDQLLLRVHISKSENPLHCIAVTQNQVVDPDDGIWRPLQPESFSDLGIGEVLRAFRIVCPKTK